MKDPLIGQQLANFRVERLLGQGGMATVYYGQDIKLQRPVAIKVIDKRYKNDAAYATRFVNEARVMAKWRHENIIQIYYADDAQGFSYYVMEYVDGRDLSSVMALYIEEGGLMPIADVLRIGNAVANALDYAHQEGVIHRDIKPSNIMISKDGRVLLGDFGMALEVRDGSMGSIFGTPHYISPEQARRSADAVPQSDLYSLGVILYEILTGITPFNDPSPASIALQHISEAPPMPRSINPEISLAVEAVLLQALEKNPKNRFQSGAKLMAALEQAIHPGGSSIAVLPLPPLPVGVPTIKRSGTPMEQIAKRNVPKGKKDTVPSPLKLPSSIHALDQHQRNRWIIAGLILLLLLGVGSWLFAKNKPASITATATPGIFPAPPASIEAPAQPTEVSTQLVISPTAEQSDNSIGAVVAAPTIKYPDGNNFAMFWNDTSFILFNRSRTRRSYSDFTFERLDTGGSPTDRFYGYNWFDARFKYLPSKTCLNIYISQAEEASFLQPSECSVYGYLAMAKINLEKEPDKIFWNPKEGSTQFRVLWLNEEIARCEISAGTCEIYVP